MWQGAFSGRAEAVGEGLMVGAKATLTRSPAGKDWGISTRTPFPHPLISTRRGLIAEPNRKKPGAGGEERRVDEENKQEKPAHLLNMHHFIWTSIDPLLRSKCYPHFITTEAPWGEGFKCLVSLDLKCKADRA